MQNETNVTAPGIEIRQTVARSSVLYSFSTNERESCQQKKSEHSTNGQKNLLHDLQNIWNKKYKNFKFNGFFNNYNYNNNKNKFTLANDM